MSKDSVNSGRKNGRPRKGDPPRVPYEELDRILVFGEIVPCEDGESTTVHYPSYRDLAERFCVSHSLIAQYAKKHDCMRRRDEAKARIAAKADQKLVELRAHAVALSKDDALRIIDNYLGGFEKALSEGRVRFDNPGDFNTMLRLKEFIQGGADSRQEIHASLSLEDIQARHRRAMAQLGATPAAVRGEVPRGPAKSTGSGDRDTTHDSPSLLPHGAAGELTEQFQDRGERSVSGAHGAPERAPVGLFSETAPTGAEDFDGADTARTAPHVRSTSSAEVEP